MCTFKFLHLVGGSATSCCWYTFLFIFFYILHALISRIDARDGVYIL